MYLAWDPTYQVLYPTVTVGRVAPLKSVADGAASWCHSLGQCRVVLLNYRAPDGKIVGAPNEK